MEASQYECLIQGLEIAADCSIYLSRSSTLSYELCSTPGIIVFADKIQFYGVYLVDQHFPVVVYLTPPLSYTNVDDRKVIVRSIVATGKYINETMTLISTSASVVSQLHPLTFKYDSMFYKPIRCEWKSVDGPFDGSNDASISFTNVERMMYIYNILYKTDKSKDFVLFPVGLMCVPTNNQIYFDPIERMLVKYFSDFENEKLKKSPIIIFPNLSSLSWTNNKPKEQVVISSYLEALSAAVNVLNQAAVAHMDLRPHNIMWNWDEHTNSIRIQIIDFEDAVLFGSKIRSLDKLKGDNTHRYPPMPLKELEYASEYHNRWFLVSITSWLRSTAHESTFSEYMQVNHDSIAQSEHMQVSHDSIGQSEYMQVNHDSIGQSEHMQVNYDSIGQSEHMQVNHDFIDQRKRQKRETK